ncbi:MAG: hypothetical protein V8S08_10980 [Lachnoclostridium sp.]
MDGKRISSEIHLSEKNQERLLNFSMLCNDSTNTDGMEIGDPTETALINLGSKLGKEAQEVRACYERKSEIPFDSDRKLMSTAHVIDHVYTMVVKGAVDVLLDRMSHIRIGETVREITEEDKQTDRNTESGIFQRGLRVLAFAYKEMDPERELTLDDENN